jgi:hypothetical protein
MLLKVVSRICGEGREDEKREDVAGSPGVFT